MRIKRIVAMGLLVLLLVSFTGCASLESALMDMKGNLIGTQYTIDCFDNFGDLSTKVHGEKISIKPNIIRETTYTGDGWGYTKTLSSAITINIDGQQMVSCGDTCIFYEKGLNPDYNFSVDKISSTANGINDVTSITGIVNDVKNSFGKPIVVVVKSQMGEPIYAFSGNNVYWEIPDDLPKMTMFNIDGKRLYIHRANYQIIDTALLDN